MREMPEMPPRLARALDREIARWVPPLTGIDAADMRQESLLVWWRVTERYDPTRGVSLQAYGRRRVLGRVQEMRGRATTDGRFAYYPLEERAVGATPPVEREVWVWSHVQQLPPRWAFVVERYYREEWTLMEIGQALEVSPERIGKIHRQALRRLRQVLEAG